MTHRHNISEGEGDTQTRPPFTKNKKPQVAVWLQFLVAQKK
jgi:hypothetical protein